VAGRFAGLPRFHRGALGIFAVTALLTAIVGDQPLGAALRVEPGALYELRGLWQPFTANFVYPEGDAGFLIGSLLIQWFFGSQLEEFWGTRRYLVLVLACGTAGYLAYALLSPVLPALPHGGATAIDLAALTAFGVVFGKRMLSMLGALEIRARTLAIILVALGVLGPLLRGAPWPFVVPWLVAIAGALLVTLQPWRRTGDSGRVTRPKKKGKTRAKHLRVVDRDPEMLN
jgi:membrane associated rhomboid family serine protease